MYKSHHPVCCDTSDLTKEYNRIQTDPPSAFSGYDIMLIATMIIVIVDSRWLKF